MILSRDFLDRTQNNNHRGNIDKLDFTKIKNCYSLKDTL